MGLKDSIRIMVVDDMSTSRGILTNALHEIGIKQVSSESDGQAALKKLVDSPVHLVISDFNMPGLDGLQLLKAIRTNPSTKKIGFIMVTGSEDRSVIEQGQKLGMNNYLKKPVTPDGIRACIERVAGKLG